MSTAVEVETAAQEAPSPRRRRRLQGVAMVVLALGVLSALTSVWSVFGTFDPNEGRLPPDEHPLFFPS